MPIDRIEAIARLTARWNEQCERWPLMRRDIPLALYLQRNVALVMRRGLLASYGERQ